MRTTPRKPQADTGPGERLQKVLSGLGLASRREAEGWIKAGRLTVNGNVAELGSRVRPSDQLRLDGRLIKQQPSATEKVFLCHRSPGENLAPGSDATMPALLERLPKRAGKRFVAISPMPRIDGGLELVTSDGELAAKLQRSIRTQLSKFSVRIKGELTDPQVKSVMEGTLDRGVRIDVSDVSTAGGEAANRWYEIATRGASGKDVRQLFERQGALVSRVLRIQLGSLALDRHLARGQFRELEPEELVALLAPPSPPAAPEDA